MGSATAPSRSPPACLVDRVLHGLESIQEGIVLVDASTTVLFCNRSAHQWFDLRCGEGVPEGELGALMLEAMAGEVSLMDAVRPPAGHPVAVRVSPLTAGTAVWGALCHVFELASLSEVALKAGPVADAIQDLNAIIDHSEAGLWICDGSANVVRVNPASARFSALEPDEIIGRNMRDLIRDGYMDQCSTLEVLRTRKRVSMLVRTRAGVSIMVTGTPVFDEDGNIFRVVVTERDMTDLEKLHQQLEEQRALGESYLREIQELQRLQAFKNSFVARSPSMLKILKQAVKLGRSDTTVLVLGESGVGKGVVAELIHQNSSRARSPLIKINCGAIPESLIESELFGYEKGAFTGARSEGKPGYLEMADTGTLFLDEIAELPLPSQVKLLRFLEDGGVTRLGGTRARTVNVRILAATNRNLESMVAEGRFREDLYYRLHVIPLVVPPLRERKDCLPALLRHYIDHFSSRLGTRKQLAPSVREVLTNYSYPGNVRELVNICERLVVLSDDEYISLHDLPIDVVKQSPILPARARMDEGSTLRDILEEAERWALMKAKKEHRTQEKMARALGISQPTVARRLKKYGI